MAKTTITTKALDGVYVDSTYPEYNYGQSTDMYIGSEYVASGQYRYYHAYIKSYIQLPLGKKTISLKFKLSLKEPAPEQQFRIYFYEILSEWDETTITYNNRPKRRALARLDVTIDTTAIITLEVSEFVTLETLRRGIGIYAESSGATKYLHFGSPRDNDNTLTIELVAVDYPKLPIAKSPILGETVAPSGGVVRFSWKHNPSEQSNLPQKGYNLQISGDGLTWETITATSTNQYADVPIAKIPSGNFYWRVQTIDTDDAPSDYSDQAYAYYGTAPTAPSIVTSVFTSAKPRLIWTTTFAQSAYKVQILKGATYIVDITAESSDQFYDIPVALENGQQYTVRVSARDEAAHYSAWAEDAITASYIVPTTPSFILSKKKDSVEITISHNEAGILRYDIYRAAPGDTDFIRIGSTSTKKYVDWSVMDGENRYKVIAVNASGESEGAQQSTTFELTTGWLTPVDDPAHPFEVRYNVQDRYYTDYDVSMMEYAGREKPVAEFGQIAQRSISVSFATNDKDAYKALERVIQLRKTVLYRNARMKMYGVCISPSDQPADYYGMIYNLSFIINEVEHSEVV